MNTNKVATTIKLDTDLYDSFKVLGIRHKHTLQAFIEKCVFRYVNDDLFRNSINEFHIPVLSYSGSL